MTKFKNNPFNLRLMKSTSVLKWLVLINLILAIIYLLSSHVLVIHSRTIRHLFDLNEEANIPTWFSSIQLFLIFILAITCAMQIESKHLRNFYFLIGFVFLFFSMDETAQIHENITHFFKKLSYHSIFPDDHGFWILVYPVILLISGLIYGKGLQEFLKEKSGRTIFITGAIVYFLGVVICEVLGYHLSADLKPESILSIIEITSEESLELLGQSLMIYALMVKLLSMNCDTNKKI